MERLRVVRAGRVSRDPEPVRFAVVADRSLDRAFTRGEAVIINSVDDLQDGERADEYEALSVQGIQSLVVVPLEVDGRLVGYMGADDPKKGRLEIIEKPLVSLASFISASMKRAMAERQVDELTWKDGLTGGVLAQRVPSRLRLRDVREHRFVLVDADRLAVVNRERSRDEGDEVLRRICSSMREVFGEGVYRFDDIGTVVEHNLKRELTMSNKDPLSAKYTIYQK